LKSFAKTFYSFLNDIPFGSSVGFSGYLGFADLFFEGLGELTKETYLSFVRPPFQNFCCDFDKTSTTSFSYLFGVNRGFVRANCFYYMALSYI